MDLNNAIAAHAAWKTKLRMAITRKEAMDAGTISKDNQCELGKWLYGEGKAKCGGHPEFTSLIEKHKAFHIEAGKVATLINEKKFEQAEKSIDGQVPFATASAAVGVAINALKKVAV